MRTGLLMSRLLMSRLLMFRLLMSRLLTLPDMQASRHGLRETWAAWNPQRAAAHQLQQVQSGHINLQDTVNAHRLASSATGLQHEVVPGTITAAEACAKGWCQHAEPFEWPAAKTAQAWTLC